MAADQTRRLSPSILQADIDTLDALRGITGYNPVNSECAITALLVKADAQKSAQATETRKQGEADAARDDAVAAEWAFHNVMLAAKDQVKAQFGGDSNEWQALGLTKKSEKAKPHPKTPPPPPTPPAKP